MSLLSRRSLLLAAPALLLPGVARAALLPTPRSTDGPFYPDRMPADDDNDLVKVEGQVREAGGDILELSGQVLDRNGKPVSGARVEIWQCDLNGIYLHRRGGNQDRRDAGFQGFGHATAKADGAFAFRTIVPVRYSGRTPHIHLKVLEDRRELLTTQVYRAGYEQNATDFLFRRMSAAEQERASMVLRPIADTARETYAASIQIVI